MQLEWERIQRLESHGTDTDPPRVVTYDTHDLGEESPSHEEDPP